MPDPRRPRRPAAAAVRRRRDGGAAPAPLTRSAPPPPSAPPPDWLPPALAAGLARRAVPAGATLFRQGDPVRAIFAVARGRLRLLRHTIDSRPVALHAAGPGELLAEAALFAPRYHCDAVAATDAEVWVLPKPALLAAFAADPAAALAMMAALARQVMRLRGRLEGRDIRSARDRLLHHLALAAGPDGRTVTLAGSLMDLAAEIGLTHETLYRTLAALEAEGAIARGPGRLILSAV